MKVWEASSAQGIELIPSVQPGYEFKGFAELAETVMYSSAHEGYIAVQFHTAENVTTTDGEQFHTVWVVQIDRASADSYNMEQFAYADPPETLYQAMFDTYGEAKAAWLEMLGNFVIDRGV